MKLHPAIVHFPIALLCVAALFAFLSFFIKKDVFKEIVFWNLLLGLLGATLAVFTGLLDEQGLKHGEEIHTILQKHKFNGIAIIFVFQVLLIWFGLRRNIFKNKEYMIWFICLLFGVSMIFYQGFLGGKMVFEHGAGVKAMEKQSQKSEGDSTSDSHDHNKGNSSGDMKGMDMSNDDKSNSKKNDKDDMNGMNMNNKNNSKKNDKDDMSGMNMNNDNKNNSKKNDKDDMSGMNMNNDNKNNPKKNDKDDMNGMNMNNDNKNNSKKNAMDTIILEDNNPGRKKVKTKKHH